jgi:tRNA G18 (ribose-2'-O)-methylase SpoU
MINSKKTQSIHFEILLHDIRSVQNVASIFRLADCIGCSKIILSGITPGPIDRFARVREDFNKISLGSENFIKWERIGEEIQNENFKKEIDKKNLETVLNFLKSKKENNPENNFEIIALEQSEKSVDYKILAEKIKEDFENSILNKKYLIVPGREVEGLDKSILESECLDYISEIPQYGQKESLNIFSSLSIVLYKWFDK